MTPPVPLTIAAVPDMTRLMQAAYRDGHAQPWAAAEIANLMEQPGALVLGLGEPLAGFVLARQVLDELELLHLAVDPAQRRRHIADRLINALLEEAPRHGFYTVFLETACDNHPAIKLYQKNGFIITGRRPGYYRGIDALNMILKLR